ncbi:MAG: dihydrofolate reductase [Bdellovibrionaceae bacterium]|nr:dihydrofolate reductase [Pseudobdellovibrionaceae bacterium]|tara:strand:- start:3341 stop:3817 length:477 start_codon:yes stop_codon:yes gene_type:complete
MISLIAAMAENRVIGKDGTLPWNIPSEMKYFRETTSGCPIIMGRKTLEELGGKPLPKRRNIVITRNRDLVVDSRIEVFHSLKEAIENISSQIEVFVIGGAQMYKEALPYCDRIYLTSIHETYEGDTYFPEFNEESYEIIRETFVEEDPSYTIRVYQKK